MKRISSKIIISLLLAIFLWSGVGFAFDKVYAQNSDATNPDIPEEMGGPVTGSGLTNQPSWTLTEPIPPNGGCVLSNVPSIGTDRAANLAAYSARDACLGRRAVMNATATTTPEDDGENWYDWIAKGIKAIVSGPLKLALGIIAGIIQLAVIPTLAAFAKIIASALDLATQFTLNSANISNVNAAVLTVWSIVRNVFNITFIFILLYTAIKTIIGSADANTKKMIASVITAALLINFSLFITRILIDAGNILAVNFYNLATEQGSISTVIANVLGLGSIWATTEISCVICTEFFIVTAIQTIAIIVVIVTFSYIAMLMLVRSVVLIFLMVLSPIGFMGTVLPKLAEYSKMWWENLYGQVFVAPIFLLLFYLITKIGNSLSLGSAMITDFVGPMTPEETAKIAQENAAYTQYFKYILIIILLFAAVKITKKMSGVVGGAVEGFAKFAAGAAVGAVTGGAALALRRTVGARAQTMTEDQGLKDRAAAGDRGAMLQLATAKKMAGASFDVRATDTFKKTTGFIGDQTGLKVDYGAGVAIQKGGYVGTIKEKEKKAEEEAKYMTEGIKVKDEEIMAEMDVAARARSEMARLRSIPSRSRDEERMLSEHEEDLKKYNERFKGIEDAKDKKEFMKKVIEKEKKDERLEKLAVREENKITNKIFGGGKEKAKKIRDAKKEKSGAEKLQDAVKQAAEEENKKKAAATATPAAPAPAPAAPPATPPPPPPATP